MQAISFADAEKLLQRWRNSSATVRIILSASSEPISEGIITEAETSPGQIVVSVYLLSKGFEKRLVLKDCEFFGSDTELLAQFKDDRALRIIPQS